MRATGNLPVPVYLRDVHYEADRGGEGRGEFKGNGTGYKYAHDYPHNYVDQQYLPDVVAGEVFYEPTDNGYEEKIRANFERIGRRKGSN